MRQRSKELFKKNLYARGIVRRIVTNVVNTGLEVEATPEEKILGFGEDDLAEWAEDTENRFKLWASNPLLCDFQGKQTFGELQKTIERESIINGDVLIVLRQNKATGLPRIQIVDASLVQSPVAATSEKIKIEHGVELDSSRRHIAFHIKQDDGTTTRLPAFERKTGRRIAWLVYGTDKLHEDVRGEPLLSIVLQSLKEIDRYRDSAQRKAVVNSLVAMFIKRTTDKPATSIMTAMAVKNDKIKVPDSNGECKTYQIAHGLPGQVVQGLQEGEEPVMLGGNGTDVNIGLFEQVVISGISWALEFPPEIMTLSFSSNYAASQAAINELKIYLNMKRKNLGDGYLSYVYEDWCISEALMGRLDAPGFLEAWRDRSKYYELTAWLSCDWQGAIKLATDLLKQGKGYEKLIELGAITRDRTSKELTGTKFSKNVKKLKRENEALAASNQVLIDQENQASQLAAPQQQVMSADDISTMIDEKLTEALEEREEEIENV